MPRIVFSDADLTKVRVAKRPHLMWELVLSLHLLQHREGSAEFGAWRKRVATAARDDAVRQAVQRLCELDPNGRYFPDFLTPAYSDLSAAAAISRVVATPQELVRAEVAQLARDRPMTRWLHDLASSPQSARDLLQESLTAYYRIAIEPYEADLVAACRRDRERRTADLRTGGLDGLFEGFDPGVLRWEPPVLDVAAPGNDLRLGGRGLLLIPSTFCWQQAITPADPGSTPTLVYPAIRPESATQTVSAGPSPSLSALLGRRRAGVLAAAAAGGTTSSLAERLDLPRSSVSEHISVLREAGLVTSYRRSKYVVHTTTLLGEELLGSRRADGPTTVEPTRERGRSDGS